MRKPLVAAVAAAMLLAGCSGGGSKVASSVPPVPTQNQVKLPTAMATIVVHTAPTSGSQSAQRNTKYFPPNAASIVATVTPVTAPGQTAQYNSAAFCVNIVAGVTTYNLNIPAPVGNDALVISSFAGQCGTTPVAGGPSIPPSGVSNPAPSTLPAALSTINSTIILVNSGAAGAACGAGFPPGQTNCFVFTLGEVINATASGITGSLSSTTANLTTAEMDPTISMAIPFTLTLKDGTGATLTSPDSNNKSVTLLNPVVITLQDKSLTPAAGAFPGAATLALALHDSSVPAYVKLGTAADFGVVGTPFPAGCPTGSVAPLNPGGSIVAPIPEPASGKMVICLPAALSATQQIIVFYNGVAQNVFQGATLTAASGSTTLSTVPINSQAQVTTPATTFLTSTGAFFANPTTTDPGPIGIAVGAAHQTYITDGSRIHQPAVGAGPLFAPAAGAAAAISAAAVTGSGAANFSGISDSVGGTASVYAVDVACQGCAAAGTNTGIWTVAAPFANGAALTRVTVPNGNASLFQSGVGYPFPAGPVGIVAQDTGCPAAATAGTCLYVAANNSIYRIDLTGAATTTVNVTLVAGTGIAGIAGVGTTDNVPGLQAKFNFTDSGSGAPVTFVGMALDAPPGTAPKNLYVSDPGNKSIRKITLSSGAVSTFANFSTRPSGIAVDFTTATPTNAVYSASPTNHLMYQTVTANATVQYAGQGGVSGTSNGLALQAYPVQFNAGNSIASATSTGITCNAATFVFCGALGIAANSNQGAQKAAGVSSFIASLNGPQGLAIDPLTGFFFEIDAADAVTTGAFTAIREIL